MSGAYDNTYYQAMLDKLQKPTSFGTYEGSFEGFIKNYSTTLGEDIEFYSGRLKTTQSITETLLDSISKISGVSMDEEGVELMAYQKAYNSIARVMTALDEALDKLINGTGLVGR